MKAEIGIDDEGRAYVCLDGMTMTEWNMLRRLRAFLPLTVSDYDGNARITGDRLPGMGNLTAQDATLQNTTGLSRKVDATAPSVSTEESIARKREAR